MSKIEVKLFSVNGLRFVSKSKSNFPVILKAPKVISEIQFGSSLMELLLIALAGCTAYDICEILSK